MNVLAYDSHPNDKGRAIAEYVELDEIFAKSDVISLHCPLFPSTEGIINKDNIARMKDGVIIINNSRGQLIVEKDLADALNSGKVYAAGLDVVSTEPIKGDNPLLKAKNCIITPHISWAPKEARQRIMDMSVENLKQFLAGRSGECGKQVIKKCKAALYMIKKCCKNDGPFPKLETVPSFFIS